MKMEIKGYEEITQEEEYCKLPYNECISIFNHETEDYTYFKKVEVFQKVFEGEFWKFEVDNYGNIYYELNSLCYWIGNDKDFNALKQAVEFADKIRKMKNKNLSDNIMKDGSYDVQVGDKDLIKVKDVKEYIKKRDALDRLYMIGKITRQEHSDECDELAGADLI